MSTTTVVVHKQEVVARKQEVEVRSYSSLKDRDHDRSVQNVKKLSDARLLGEYIRKLKLSTDKYFRFYNKKGQALTIIEALTSLGAKNKDGDFYDQTGRKIILDPYV